MEKMAIDEMEKTLVATNLAIIVKEVKNRVFFREIAEFIISRGIIYIYIPASAMYFIFS